MIDLGQSSSAEELSQAVNTPTAGGVGGRVSVLEGGHLDRAYGNLLGLMEVRKAALCGRSISGSENGQSKLAWWV